MKGKVIWLYITHPNMKNYIVPFKMVTLAFMSGTWWSSLTSEHYRNERESSFGALRKIPLHQNIHSIELFMKKPTVQQALLRFLQRR